MKTPCLFLTSLCLTLAVTVSSAQESKSRKTSAEEPLSFEGARQEIYKTIGDVKLTIHIFEPAGHQAKDQRPAIVFFFGGGWKAGTPKQFEQQCRYLASRGMVAMTADYRVLSRHGTKAVECVRDGKSAIRWVRENATRLGIDPQRIAAGGGSAGGHVAACVGVLAEFDEPGENRKISSRPDALCLFNPALVLANVKDREPLSADNMEGLRERMGVEPEALSPLHHVQKGAPPTIIFHGQADDTVKYWTAEAFTAAMKQAGNRCELKGAEGQAHGYFNFGRGDNQQFLKTTELMDVFLASLGWLKGKPSISQFKPSETPQPAKGRKGK